MTLAFMSIKGFEERYQMLKLRKRVLRAEEERINGAETFSIEQARERLRERLEIR